MRDLESTNVEAAAWLATMHDETPLERPDPIEYLEPDDEHESLTPTPRPPPASPVGPSADQDAIHPDV